ncbi:endonuclease/exonuclease/phosphatase family protein [Saliniramus sp.]|uniref:endonuclease/exonuclease/phosphatase family protein n=1 Tax=Saliniramus sp. TaxID=2986772 RepID=UPI002CF505C8|nr:endonuclease/exonuclease/phosphatase family protein [Saliniramus sp.]HMB11595.1 endonuclease/exonuclease/phosphatase family protein [Saliniramus sp.]
MSDKVFDVFHRFLAASYNIHRTVGSDRRHDPQRVAQVIRQVGAPVIGLQEVNWRPERELGGESQAEFLAHLPGYESIAGSNLIEHRGHYGNMLLTRYPVLAVQRHSILYKAREPRGVVDVTLDIAGQHLRVMVTHFGLSLRERRFQANRLVEIITQAAPEPVLLLGDLNDWIPGSPSIAPLLAGCDPTRSPASFPSAWPLFALDRIVTWRVGSPLRVYAHRSTLARWASDHLPVVAEIGITQNQ